MNEQGTEYWSARDLSKLVGYDKWQRSEDVIKRATIACQQIGQIVEDHITGSGNITQLAKEPPER